jgi:hypothetical protein
MDSDHEVVGEIVGKRVVGVVITENHESQPSGQLYLAFSDGTYIEFFAGGDRIQTINALGTLGVEAITESKKRRPGNKVWTFHRHPSEAATQIDFWDV